MSDAGWLLVDEEGRPLRKQARLPAWAWIIIIPLISWIGLLVALALLGFPFEVLGITGLGRGTPTPLPDESLRVLKAQGGAVKGVAFSPDGTLLASVGDDHSGRLNLWRVADGSPIYVDEAQKGNASGVAFSPDGKTLATSGQDHVVRFWNVAKATPIRDLTGSVGALTSVAFSPDGRTIAAGSWGVSEQSVAGTVLLWSVDDGKLLELNANSSTATRISFSPDGHYLAAGGNGSITDPGAYIWHLPDGKLVQTINGVAPWDVKFAPGSTGGKGSATLAVDTGEIRFVSVPDGAVTHSIRYEGSSVRASIAFSPDGRWLATGAQDNTVKLLRVADGKALQTWRGHESWVECVAFLPDGKLVASGSADGTVRLWQVPNPIEK